MKTLFKSIIILVFPLLFSCSGGSDESKGTGPYRYVKPSIDSRGRYRKGHMRKSVSTDKNAYKNRARSRYYYQTRGKYRRKARSSSR